MRTKGFDEGKIYTIKKANDVSASFKCTQKRYLSQRYRLLRGVPSIFIMQESLPLKIESAKLTFLCDNNAQGFISRIYLNVHFMPKHKQGLNIRILLQFLQREAIYHKERRLLI